MQIKRPYVRNCRDCNVEHTIMSFSVSVVSLDPNDDCESICGAVVAVVILDTGTYSNPSSILVVAYRYKYCIRFVWPKTYD